MKLTVRQLKKELPEVPVLVGGAVVTRRYAEEIGADGYGKTAFEAVHMLRRLNPGVAHGGSSSDSETGNMEIQK